MSYLNISNDLLNHNNALSTAKEIYQQPEMWQKTQDLLEENAETIDAFLKPILATKNLRIILTGAGSSSYIGQCLAPLLLKDNNVEAIATTDLVSGPHLYFKKKTPTLLVSFSRSGDSPESLAAANLYTQLVDTCYQLVITCNEEGALYKSVKADEKNMVFLLPPETHDQSFAMTSSFTSMLYVGLKILSKHAIDLNTVCKATMAVINEQNDDIKILTRKNFWRVVFLGSNGLKSLAREASLKLLELTDGQIVTTYESSLGFRHGPKAIISGNTIVFVFISNDPHTRQYDLDLLNEIRRDRKAGLVVALSSEIEGMEPKRDHIIIKGLKDANDCELMFPLIVYAQLYAFHSALKLGNSPDSPCVSGTVNRVVQGVTIHPYNAR